MWQDDASGSFSGAEDLELFHRWRKCTMKIVSAGEALSDWLDVLFQKIQGAMCRSFGRVFRGLIQTFHVLAALVISKQLVKRLGLGVGNYVENIHIIRVITEMQQQDDS